jgi:O-antigen ligase
MFRSEIAAVSIPQFLRARPWPVIALAAVAALLLNFLFASGHDLQRCVEIILLCGIALAVLRNTTGTLSAIPKSTGCLLLGFFALGLLSALSAYSLRHAIYEWSGFLLLGMLVFAVGAELSSRRNDRLQQLFKLIGATCALYSLKLLVMYAAALASGYQLDMHALAVGFSNVRFLNHTQTALLPLVVLLCLQAPAASKVRRAWFALAAFWWAVLYVSEARASILAIGAGSVLALALRASHARKFLKIMALSALAGAVIYVLAFILLPILAGLQPIGVPSNVVARTAADPTSSRTFLWQLALQLIAAHPWLGVGPHHFAHEGHKLYFGAHPHDWLFQIAVEWGVPALLCLLGALVLGARALVRSGKCIADDDLRNQQILVCLLAACAAIFVDGLFSGVLVMPQSRLAIALVVGCAVGWTRALDAGAAVPKPAPVLRYVTAALVLAASCGLVWSVTPSFMQHARGEALTPAEQAINDKGNWPRLWEAGYF